MAPTLYVPMIFEISKHSMRCGGFDKFNARTKNLTSDTAAMYAYRWGYMETLVKEMILRSPDEERDFICKSLIG